MAYSYSRSITVDHTKCGSSNSSNFPVLVSIASGATWLKTAANGGHVQNASGFDLVFTSDAGGTTLLKWEVELYDGVNGQLIAWVQVPTLSHTANSVFYLFYGNAAISTFQGGSTGSAWDTNFKGVWHLPNGTTLSANDSTANANNGSITGATAAAGQIDGAASFTNGSAQDITGTLAANVPIPVTVSMWIQPSSVSVAYASAFEVNDGANDQYNLGMSSGGNFWRISFGGVSDYEFTSLTAFSAGTWYYVAVTVSGAGGTATCYLGSAGAITTQAIGSLGTPTGTPSSFTIGADITSHGSTAVTWPGLLDEVRLSNAVRSADWITAEYNNQNAPSSFYALGSELTPSGGSPAQRLCLLGCGS